jgi:2-haloacid dehalogenase
MCLPVRQAWLDEPICCPPNARWGSASANARQTQTFDRTPVGLNRAERRARRRHLTRTYLPAALAISIDAAVLPRYRVPRSTLRFLALQDSARRTVIFDLGGVLLDWDPRYLYRRLFGGDMEGMEHFLANVCTPDWNRMQDGGRPFAEAEAEAAARHPDKLNFIQAWRTDFSEMIAGPIEGSVAILSDLRQRNVPLFALTNWSAETFAPQQERFDFLAWFDGIVVSGQERLIKPDLRIFRVLLERYSINPQEAVFVDDAAPNVAAARELGMHGIDFTGPETLRRELVALLLL